MSHLASLMRHGDDALAAMRLAALRTAFLREDPRRENVIAPFRVQSILMAQQIHVPVERVKRFLRERDGRFRWGAFCDDLEKDHMRQSAVSPLALPGAAQGAALLASPAAAASAYSRLQGVQLARASDAATVEITKLWRKDLLGLGGERAVVVFLRHFG